MFESTLSSIGIILMALLPVLLWLWFFFRKQPEKKTYIALTFLAGMASVLPIKFYEAYWDTGVLSIKNINLFQSLSDLVHFQGFSQLLAFIFMSLIVAFGLFVFVAIMMFFLEVLSGDNTVGVFKRKLMQIKEQPFFFVTVGIAIGLYAYFSSFSMHEKIYFFLIVGMLEEFVKNLVLRFADEFKIHSVDDALEFAIVVALGFAFVENVLYFQNIIEGGKLIGRDLYMVIIMRSTISVLAHVIFSSVFGYFYGVANFSSDIYKNSVKASQHFIIRKIHQIIHMKEETLFHEEQLFIGMFLAMGLHAIYNSLLEFNRFDLVIPFILSFLYIILNLFHQQKFAIMSRKHNLLT